MQPMPSPMQAAMPSRIQVIGGAIQVIAGFSSEYRSLKPTETIQM
jgi:hypothetical protein